MRSVPKTAKIPAPIWEALRELRRGVLKDYPSDNAALVGILVYVVTFPIPHKLTAALARRPADEQDLVHDFLLKAVREGIDLRERLPKPATVEALIALARGEQIL